MSDFQTNGFCFLHHYCNSLCPERLAQDCFHIAQLYYKNRLGIWSELPSYVSVRPTLLVYSILINPEVFLVRCLPQTRSLMFRMVLNL